MRSIGVRSLTILIWKNLRFTEKIHRNTRLATSDVFHMLNYQSSYFNSIIVQTSEKLDSLNRQWLLLSVTFTAKLELAFVLTFDNAFS